MSDVVLETRDVKKFYKMGSVTVQALRGVDVSLKSGEFVSIIGPSGSGKSTLLNLLGCLDRPTEGSVLLDGTDVSKMGERQLTDMRCKKIGYVFQKFYLLPFLTALENVELQARLAGVKDSRRRAEEALRLVGLDGRMGHMPKEMSGGEQQRVAIARALVKAPKLLLADEPTGNLDTATGSEVMRTLKKLNEQGLTILMVTHNPELAAQTDRIIRVKDGLIDGSLN
ncbi:ABC transporter ATP binding protein [Methanocella paludicola SANAE]|uniref:ABC transporter ATP binding protein n=1 Tax=Methanocella paludicola (strain DSM 17711 / JCM 13418 / NBRC 101707 / SANAE) TaxID=304371 RepID=D1Z134_METPS|nr:ABC transporter ATP-binding protein [Methanocella paludicola]BAI62406.1 ABC transporter ATP binding protein [Methanocella paludicola SANAE]